MKKIYILFLIVFIGHNIDAQTTQLQLSSRKAFTNIPRAWKILNSDHYDAGFYKSYGNRWGYSAFITFSRVKTKDGGSGGSFDSAQPNARNSYNFKVESLNTWIGAMLSTEYQIFKTNPHWRIGTFGGLKLHAMRNTINFDFDFYPENGGFLSQGGSRSIFYEGVTALAAGGEILYERSLSESNSFVIRVGYEGNFNLRDKFVVQNETGGELPQGVFERSTESFLNNINIAGPIQSLFIGAAFRQVLF